MSRILIVDDDLKWQDILQHQLSSRYEVGFATNSYDAISKIEDAFRAGKLYDAYVLDTMFLDKPTGVLSYEAPLKLARQILQRGAQPTRIFMIGYVNQLFMQEASELGIIKFYYKEKKSKVEGQQSYVQIRADLDAILK